MVERRLEQVCSGPHQTLEHRSHVREPHGFNSHVAAHWLPSLYCHRWSLTSSNTLTSSYCRLTMVNKSKCDQVTWSYNVMRATSHVSCICILNLMHCYYITIGTFFSCFVTPGCPTCSWLCYIPRLTTDSSYGNVADLVVVRNAGVCQIAGRSAFSNYKNL